MSRRRYRRNYPRSVSQVLDDNIKYKGDVLRALKRFRRSKPWRGTIKERKAKLTKLHFELRAIYNLGTTLSFDVFTERPNGNGSYSPAMDHITLRGKISVVTYLHEFAHALGKDEFEACRWSINLFRRIFPRSYERCDHRDHLLIQRRPRSSQTD